MSFNYFKIISLGIIILGTTVLFSLVHTHQALALTSPEALQQLYNSPNPSRKIKVLIVPGHDTEYWGTQYRDVKEGDLTLELGENLYNLLKQDPKLDVTLARDGTSDYTYSQQFADYFKNNAPAIQSFITSTHNYYSQSISSGSIVKLEGVPHNDVSSDIALRLYGINKWINDNNIDVVLHIHFNDTPNRPSENPGPYSGFAIYIPEKQYTNGPASAVWGASLYNALNKYYYPSTMPQESGGLVPEQDLIAIGPGNSLNEITALIEYGYIYEPQFLDPTIRASVINDLSFQTFLGIHNFFGSSLPYVGKYGTPLLPYTWARASSTIELGTLYNPDVLALQAALRLQGLYPVKNLAAADCRMTGDFNPCTKQALIEFQQKYNIPATGFLGPLTRTKLNKLFSSTTSSS